MMSREMVREIALCVCSVFQIRPHDFNFDSLIDLETSSRIFPPVENVRQYFSNREERKRIFEKSSFK